MPIKRPNSSSVIFCGCEIFFKPVAQIVETRFAVEPVQEGEFFLLEAKVIQADRIFYNPVLPALVVAVW